MAPRPSRRRQHSVLLVVMLMSAGCETHELTREPEQPIGATGWTTIWIAAILCVGVTTALVVRLATKARPRSAERLVLGGVFTAASVAGGGAVLFQVAADLRADQILGGGDCRSISASRRPVQIVQLTCTDGGLDLGSLGWALVIVVALPLAVPVVASAVIALRGEARPWFPTVVAAIAVVGATAGGGAAALDGSIGPALALIAIACVAGVGLCSGVLELRRPAPAPEVAPQGDGPVTAAADALPLASPVDRMQAAIVDVVLAYLLGAIAASAFPDSARVVVLSVVVSAWFVGSTVLWGATVGKRTARLQVRRAGSDQLPGMTASVVRTVLLYGAPITAGIAAGNALVAAATWALLLGSLGRPARRGLHDLAAGTEVVRRPG